jgi:hypothetical protein
MFLGKKDPKKNNNRKCKANALACYMSFRPNLQPKNAQI